MIAETDVRTCRGCGCTDEQCCEGGCWWVEDEDVFSDLCSACVPVSRGDGLLLGGAVRESGRTSRLTDGEQAAAIDSNRVLDECELHFLTDCRECAEADVILLARGLP